MEAENSVVFEQNTKKKGRKCPAVVAAVGLVLFVAGVVLLLVAPELERHIISRSVALSSKSSPIYRYWADPSKNGIEMYRSFTFFNLTNPHEVGKGATPNFVMRGPFVYTESRTVDENSVEWNADGTVSYRYGSVYHFVPERSIDTITGEQLSASERITSANAPLFGLAHRMSVLPEDMSGLPKQVFCEALDWLQGSEILGPTGIMTQRTVDEILWGYIDPIWSVVHDYLGIFNYTGAQTFRAEWNGSSVVPSPYSYRSGQMCPLWDNLNNCNNSFNRPTVEESGSTPSSLNGMMSQWAGQRNLWWWGPEKEGIDGGEEVLSAPPTNAPNGSASAFPPTPDGELSCQKIDGYSGTRFPPNNYVKGQKRLGMFLDMVWRNLDFVHRGSSSVFDIPTERFELDADELDPTKKNNSLCYQARRMGILNFTRPLFGPAVGSKAMFLDTDLRPDDLTFTMSRDALGDRLAALTYVEKYFGNRSSAEFRRKFESYVEVNPLTGLPLDVSAKATAFAFNAFGPIHIPLCKSIPSSLKLKPVQYFPLVSVDRHASVSASKARTLRGYLFMIELAHWIFVAFIVVGGLMFVLGAYTVRSRSQELKREEKTSASAPPAAKTTSPLLQGDERTSFRTCDSSLQTFDSLARRDDGAGGPLAEGSRE